MIIIITTTFTLIIHMVEDGSSRVLDCGARCVVVLSAELDVRHHADHHFRSRSHDGCAFQMATNHAAVSSTHCAVQVVLPVGAQSSGERDDLQLLNIRIDL